MNRLHIHVGVSDLERSVDYYRALFGAEPAIRKPDYAKWLLEDPRVNFAISTQAAKKGVDHLGIQVDGDADLERLSARLNEAGQPLRDEPGAACCYARSNKAWSADPEQLSWELFHTTGEIASYHGEEDTCCTPQEETNQSACCGT